MQQSCNQLHKNVSNLPVINHDQVNDKIKKDGIYFIVDRNENSHSHNRIVRIGTHTGEGNLYQRIYEHIYKENKDRSIFRKHIGRCILAKNKDAYLEKWELDLTSRKNKDKYSHLINIDFQKKIELQISDYIKSNLTLHIIEVQNKQDRLLLEKALLSTIANCSECQPSPRWLGNFHPNVKIQNSGLWNIQGLNHAPLSITDIGRLF